MTGAGILGGFLGSLQTTGIEFLAFLGLFNFYIWILVIMYMPATSHSGPTAEVPLEMVTLGGSDTENEFNNNVARELDFGSQSSDLEISLSDVNMRSPSPKNLGKQHSDFGED